MRVKLVFVSFFAYCIAGVAQRPIGRIADYKTPSLAVDVDRVNVVFSVSASSGKFITKLQRDDFKVFEDGQPQKITNFNTETNLPLKIALLVDTSGSIHGKVRFERDAASSFFYSALHRGRDKALILTFDHTLTLLQGYTDDPAVLDAAVQKIISGGSTALYDAVREAATHTLASELGRRIIIILSDGMDNSSRISLDEAIETAKKNEVVIYAVSTNTGDNESPVEHKQGDENLTQLAEETGGAVLFPGNMKDLRQSFQRIAEELRSQYSLAYSPSNARRDGTYRQIHIVPPHKHYRIRCRTGYFAPLAALDH